MAAHASRLDGNYFRRSGIVSLFPYMEQGPLYDNIEARRSDDNPARSQGGAAPWSGWTGYNQTIASLRCPSDPGDQSLPRASAAMRSAKATISASMPGPDVMPTDDNGLFAALANLWLQGCGRRHAATPSHSANELWPALASTGRPIRESKREP